MNQLEKKQHNLAITIWLQANQRVTGIFKLSRNNKAKSTPSKRTYTQLKIAIMLPDHMPR